MIRIRLTSIMVDDQEKAHKFYTDVVGFVTKHDVPLGHARWLTVVSPAERNGTELLLEPLGFAPAKAFQKALFDANIPATAFAVDDIQAEYKRMKALGVKFRGDPQPMGPVIAAQFDDTCGNYIQLFQPARAP